MNGRELTLAVLLLVTVGLIAWDIYAICTYGYRASISHQLLKSSEDYPIIPFALGVLIGHLFWPQAR